MATTNSALYNKQVGTSGSPTYPGPGEYGGKVHIIRYETTVATLGATSDILQVCKLPVGARVIPGLSKVTCESPGTTVTIKLGDSGDDDRYMASKALGGSAQDILWTNSAGVDAYVSAPVVAGVDTLLLTSITIGTPTTTAKFALDIAYKFE